jgi:nucleoside-diphosphate-sugar epimerase
VNINNRILLTGASGSFGTYLKEEWSNQSHIFFASRNNNVLQNHVTLNPYDSKQWERVILENNISIIVHNAAHTQIWGKWNEFESTNIQMMKTLTSVVKNIPHVKIVFLSTPSIYHYANTPFVTEDFYPIKFPNFYAKSKFISENILLDSGIPYIIFRPRAIVGKTDNTLLPRLMETYHSGKLRIIGNGKNIADFTSMKNLQLAIELAINAPEVAWNHIYNITNGDPANVYSIINSLLEAFSLNPVSQKVPVKLAKFAAIFSEAVSKIKQKEPLISRYQIELLSQNFTLDINKSIELLKYKPIQSNSEMIQELIQANKTKFNV